MKKMKFLIVTLLTMLMAQFATAQLFTHYTSLNTGTNQLLCNYIYDVDVKKDGSIVFGTEFGISILHNDDTWENIEAYSTSCVSLDTMGNIWAGTLNGKAYRFNGMDTLKYFLTYGYDCDGDCPVISCHVDKKNNVWYGTVVGLYKFDGVNRITPDPALPSGSYISSIIDDNIGNVWFGGGSGLLKYNGSSWVKYTTDSGLISNDIVQVTCAKDNSIWIATHSGVSVFDGNSWKSITKSNGLLDNNVYSISFDNEGKTWISTASGISIFDGNTWDYIDTIAGLDFNSVVNIIHSGDGYAWICTTNNGVFQYKKFSTSKHIYNGDGLSCDYIYSMVIDNNEKMWFACPNAFLSTYDGVNWKSFSNEDNGDLNCGYSVARDKNNNIWYGSCGSIVLMFDGDSWTTYDMESYTSVVSGIKTIFGDDEGNVWIGSYIGGVFKFNGSDWVHYSKADGLADNDVFSINQDKDGNILFGTRGGLTIYNGTSWNTLTTADGLPDNAIRDVVVDGDSLIWLATRGGLSKYDGIEFTNYTASNGLVNNEVEAVAIDKNGILWLGYYDFITKCGISRFDRKNFRRFTTEDELLGEIMDITIDNSNKVWIATFGNGIYVLNQDFVDIAEHPNTQRQFELYPNPAGDYLNIKIGGVIEDETSYQIYTSSGIPVTGRIICKESNINLSLTDFSKGVYFMVIEDRNSTDTYKFVKY